MSDIAAAIGVVQLKRLSQLNQIRQSIVSEYNRAFHDIDWLTLPQERSYVKSSWHLYQIKLPDETSRDRMINHLLDEGITPGVHYLPAHLHPYYRHFKSICPVASEIWKRILSLPIFPDLSHQEQEKVIDAVRKFKP